MTLTSDPGDPRLGHGPDPEDAPFKPPADVYLVLSEEDRAKGFVRPLRRAYWHQVCGKVTTMHPTIAETYATNPGFYGSTYCGHCGLHRPVGADGEFFWCDDDNISTQNPARQPKVGT